MTEIKGAALLKQYAEQAFPYQWHRINERIQCVVGLGHSNSIIIEGDTSIILVDTLDSDVRAAKMKAMIAEQTDKPVRTIIYTHGHQDHRGGAGAFRDTAQEIIAFAPKRSLMQHYDRINGVLGRRTARQFGFTLTDEETITQGLGIREGHTVGEGGYDFLPPTTVYTEDTVERVIDGVSIVLSAAPGETDDQLLVWLPEDKVLCCGDTYYGCWPNLYAIRGSQYRDIAVWVESLGKLMTYPAEALLPGHTQPIIGQAAVQEVLGTYRGAIESILLQTLDCIEQGLSEWETVAKVKLPPEYQDKPYLGEFYGTVQWSVRAVYNGYLGWFDGNPTNLERLPANVYNSKLLALIGDDAKVLAEIEAALAQDDPQLALELSDLLLTAGHSTAQASAYKREALLKMAERVTSANGRHYYIASANDQAPAPELKLLPPSAEK